MVYATQAAACMAGAAVCGKGGLRHCPDYAAFPYRMPATRGNNVRRKDYQLRALLGTAFFLLQLCSAAAASVQPRIEWRLENPFRLFKKAEHTAAHQLILNGLNADDRKTPVLAAERKLAEQYGGRGWAEAVYSHTCYHQGRDRYDACKDYILPKSHDALFRLEGGSPAGLGSGPSLTDACTWRRISHRDHSVAEKTLPCGEEAAFDIPYPEGARITVVSDNEPAADPAEIKVRDVLILGMGDSFAAGEGNPDHPITFNDAKSFDYGKVTLAERSAGEQLDGYPARIGKWKTLNDGKFEEKGARWWSRECHRSLYSHQLRVALQLAIENPKQAVTFISFSCSGAEITEGVLLSKPVRECTPGEASSVPAQFSALAHELCWKAQANQRMPQAIINRLPEFQEASEKELQITRCAQSSPQEISPRLKRPIDLVLLSIGGNDVGFVPLIADALLSANSVYRTMGERMNSVYGAGAARGRLELLHQRLEALRYAFDLFLDSSLHRRVILTAYPRMGFTREGTHCGGNGGMEVFPEFRLDTEKVRKSEEFTDELNAILALTKRNGWRFADGYRDEFRAHGICAVQPLSSSVAEMLNFPRFKNGVWSPFAPSEYEAYAVRQRWFRTPNDSFLTSNMHARRLASFGESCSALFSSVSTVARSYWTPFQVFLASTYGGAFHPTAEGQARIADDVLRSARAILARRD